VWFILRGATGKNSGKIFWHNFKGGFSLFHVCAVCFGCAVSLPTGMCVTGIGKMRVGVPFVFWMAVGKNSGKILEDILNVFINNLSIYVFSFLGSFLLPVGCVCVAVVFNVSAVCVYVIYVCVRV
jgi:hypothetical protein